MLCPIIAINNKTKKLTNKTYTYLWIMIITTFINIYKDSKYLYYIRKNNITCSKLETY